MDIDEIPQLNLEAIPLCYIALQLCLHLRTAEAIKLMICWLDIGEVRPGQNKENAGPRAGPAAACVAPSLDNG